MTDKCDEYLCNGTGDCEECDDSALHPDNAIGTIWDRESYEAGKQAERERISKEIDERMEAGRGASESWPETMALDWCKRNIVERGDHE